MVRPVDALAHASLVRTDPPDPCAPLVLPRLPQLAPVDLPCATGVVLPQGPASVRLFFNEPVDLVGRGVKVFAPDGGRVEQGPARGSGAEVSVNVSAGAPGTYLVTWRVIARDTHPAQGVFPFSVVRPSSPPGGAAAGGLGRPRQGLILQMLARAIHFVGYALSFGVFAFRQTILLPLSLASDAAGERRVWGLVGAGVIALVIAEPLALLAQVVSLSAGGPFDLEVVGGALDSSFGRVLAQRLGAAVLLWVLAGVIRNAGAGVTRASSIVLLLALAVALIDGEAAHAVGARPVWLGLGLNMLHEAAMGVWIGGLIGLLAIFWLPGIVPRRREVVMRVARIAGAAVAALIITGTVMAFQHLTALSDLTGTPYGRTLLAKICALAAGVLLARAAAAAPIEGRGRWWTREAAVLVGLLGVAGLLVSLPPPR